MRVAIGGLHTECASENPLEQTQDDFTRTTGQPLIETVPFDFSAHGITAIPLFHDRSVPGGPVARRTWDAQTKAFYAALRDALPLDGLLLLMHGAMFVPGVTDPEGDFIAEIRRILGPAAIIAASFDLHGQVTQQIVDHLDIFAAYRTAPHIDVGQTHQRAATMLAKALGAGTRPKVFWTPIPILAPGEMTSTFVSPCDGLYGALSDHDAQPGIWDSNLMIGYVWADSPRATAAAVVTATDRAAGQATADTIAGAYYAARDHLAFDMEAGALPELLDTLEGPAILADSGDNPTAGGVGDRADVLSEVLNRGLTGCLFAGIADPTAFRALRDGASRITLGGTLGGGGPRLTLTVEACRISWACAIANVQGNTVVITQRRRPFHDFSDFAELDLPLEDVSLLVVKSGYLSPDLRTLPRRQIMALTEGAVCQDLARLPNTHRPKGTWPFIDRRA